MYDKFDIYLILLHAFFKEDFPTVYWSIAPSLNTEQIYNRLYYACMDASQRKHAFLHCTTCKLWRKKAKRQLEPDLEGTQQSLIEKQNCTLLAPSLVHILQIFRNSISEVFSISTSGKTLTLSTENLYLSASRRNLDFYRIIITKKIKTRAKQRLVHNFVVEKRPFLFALLPTKTQFWKIPWKFTRKCSSSKTVFL